MDDDATPHSTRAAHAKQAACLNCRRSKIRCKRSGNEAVCEKCKQANLECIIPSHHVGRQKGVKNKRRGLEKALHQIEQAIKRPKSDAAGPDAAKNVVANLQALLDKAQTQLLNDDVDNLSEDAEQPHSLPSSQAPSADDNLALDDAENPLQLLARASDLQLPPPGVQNAQVSPAPLSASSTVTRGNRLSDEAGANSFFVPVKASLDTGTDIDPIELGLVTGDEAETLFSYFYQNLAHTRWGLDPFIHNATFVRCQSAFLFTSILASAALFIPSAAALSKRLARHCKLLAQRVISHRLRSVEIVLAFMVNVPWMAPGECLGDDDTCSYIAMALAVALDLSLNKIVMPSPSFEDGALKRLARADCIEAKRALHMDGFDDVDPSSELGRRLLRRRERAWIALYVVERGVCLARGRSYTVPPTALVENCDKWHIADIADLRDGSMNSMAVLRRDLDALFKKVRSHCDSFQMVYNGTDAAQMIKSIIENFYDQWYTTWALEIGEGESRTLPPYVEILVTHTRLSTYSGVINHPTAPLEVKRFFRAAGLSSALNVLRAAIQGESRLKSMPNNTVIMISFAACSALSLSAAPADSKSNLAPSVRNLIEETADVLERIGATPIHRNGASVLYGRFLRELVRRTSAFPPPLPPLPPPLPNEMQSEPVLPPTSLALDTTTYGPVLPVTHPQYSPPVFWPEPLNFSTMSDDQIVDAVNRADSSLGAGVSFPGVPLDDMMSWEWFDFNPDFSFSM
ncbi:hypothetical protein ASPZODRAFT_134198 [Penicilliopsis zonata CBS 506.65]|uniref:Zn(2)-C6 fungal-type domain-containing protein n=1 Tax=Penicilliopsis zonata CBS 506.65 TaxID=1073090 RepID=A0A1L9SEH4_9EURO|nr:hypothetical protein ASPZODRAFT_134198 [Penicilliopsis zonata CBS 506.65]OJJ45518.1 hypothetical protein ASPZODRAFT_134198 [Penicilliopsis zonata CBS 506.65]